MNVPSLAEVLDHLNVADSNLYTEVDGRRQAAIAVVEGIVGPLTPRQVVETVHHGGGPTVVLRKSPVVTVDEVRGVVTVGVNDGPSYTPGGFLVDADAGILTAVNVTLSAGWLQVTYTAGRPSGQVPADLHEAVLVQTAILWESQRSAGSARPLGTGGDPGPGLAPKVHRLEQLLAPHRRTSVGVA